MTNQKLNPIAGSTIFLLYLILGLGAVNDILANTDKNLESVCSIPNVPEQLTLNSYSFTAQKRSSFSMGELMEQTERGLTILHFNTNQKFEYRTFDTHSSEEAAAELITLLKRMLNENAVFALLAHDSAANGLQGQTEALADMSLLKLSTVKSRQAYIMHNFNGTLYEAVDDIGLSETFEVPANIADETIYFPKISYEFEPINNRYIAHAGGEINGIKSTNSKQALDENYEKGFRLFELDIIETSDGTWVAAHDWKMWARFTDYVGTLPPTLADFKKYKIYGEYDTMDLNGINAWFATHPEATLVTDKVNDPIAFANAFVDKNRLIMELFSLLAVEEASQKGIQTIISQEPLMAIKGDKLNYLAVNNIKYVAVSRRIIASQTKLLLELRDQDIKVYVYNVNFDAGKDEKYVLENEIGLVYGMYADKWMFGSEPESPTR